MTAEKGEQGVHAHHETSPLPTLRLPGRTTAALGWRGGNWKVREETDRLVDKSHMGNTKTERKKEKRNWKLHLFQKTPRNSLKHRGRILLLQRIHVSWRIHHSIKKHFQKIEKKKKKDPRKGSSTTTRDCSARSDGSWQKQRRFHHAPDKTAYTRAGMESSRRKDGLSDDEERRRQKTWESFFFN